MKQNERLLVYAVTGFLALILVIAVLFGNDTVDASMKRENTSNTLSEILEPEQTDAELAKAKAEVDAKAKALAEQLSGASGSGSSGEQPLNAKLISASDVVARAHGKSRRERFVRWVPVKSGDAFEKLVRRWCGGTQGYLAEALSLNEDTTTLKVGSEVMVPWVDDEVLATILEAQAISPRTLASNPSASNRTLMNPPSVAAQAGMPRPSVNRPSFATPGANSAAPGASNLTASNPSSSGASTGAASVITYKVKQGDSIWRIAIKRYGKDNAYSMVKAIKSLNPSLPEILKIGQQLKIPAKAE
ncbi:MAG: LysM repeat protein [Planctomycetota bacterium]|jgi:LysM repeat protein